MSDVTAGVDTDAPNRASRTKTMRSHAPEIDRYLRDRGVTYVRCEYAGRDGEGGFEPTQFQGANDTPCWISDGVINLRVKATFRALLMSRYPAWRLGDGSCGDFRWDLTRDSLIHSHYIGRSTHKRDTHHDV